MVSKNKIGGWVDKQVDEPPPSPHWNSPEIIVTKMMTLHVKPKTCDTEPIAKPPTNFQPLHALR
jgi:hypothetical protein